jgi:DNA modification methylase
MGRQAKSNGVRLQWDGQDQVAAVAGNAEAGWHCLETTLDSGPKDAGPTPAGPNVLLHSDNLTAMHDLLQRGWNGRFVLGYIDPPFAMGRDLQWQRKVGGEDLQGPAYSDRWDGGLAAYLSATVPRLEAMLPLLADDGVLVVHADWRAAAALRVALDERLGPACFRNEVIWRRAPNLGRQAASHQLGRVHDTLLVYSKTPHGRFRGDLPRLAEPWPLSKAGTPLGARRDPTSGRWYRLAPRGDYTDASLDRLEAEGRLHQTGSGAKYIRYFLPTDARGRWVRDRPLDSIWDDAAVCPLRHVSPKERLGYDTQKPEGLLQRLIDWTTRPGDWVLDPCCGSGTTAAVAERSGRRWLTIDVGTMAVHTARRRLLDRPALPALAIWRNTTCPAPETWPLQWQWLQQDNGLLLDLRLCGATLDGWSLQQLADAWTEQAPHQHQHCAFAGTTGRLVPLLVPWPAGWRKARLLALDVYGRVAQADVGPPPGAT